MLACVSQKECRSGEDGNNNDLGAGSPLEERRLGLIIAEVLCGKLCNFYGRVSQTQHT